MLEKLYIGDLQSEVVYKIKIGKHYFTACYDGTNFHFFGTGSENLDKKLPEGWFVKAEPGLILKTEADVPCILAA